MRKKLQALFCTTAVLSLFCVTDISAEEPDTLWNYDSEIIQTSGAFTYHAFTSQDEREVWIYEIDIDAKKEHGTLEVPGMLDNMPVTRLGYTEEKDEDREDFFPRNIFGNYVEMAHDADGGNQTIAGIEKINMPDSVEVVQPAAFSGADGITAIRIPEKVQVIEEETFYGCDRLKTVYLPDGLRELDVWAFADCPKLRNLKLSPVNEEFKIKDQCLIARKKKELIYVLPGKKTIKIPNGIKVIKKFAFGNCTASKVCIPASVRKIEAQAFHKSYWHQNKKNKGCNSFREK